ncbi:MAG: site-specific DNA-methyltransferase [Phormidesmis sp.]
MKQKTINSILEGDCLDVMAAIAPASIDLIYLDPPFFTGKKHTLKNKARTQEFSFDDIWGNNKNYAEFLAARLAVMRGLLKDEGSLFFHCDKSGEHIVRAVLDQVFGSNNFQAEIIWSYKRWSNSKKGLLPAHQNIYFYSKSKHFKFNTIYTSYSEATNIDQILQRRTRDQHNKSVYDTDSNGKFKHGDEKKGVPLNDVWDIPYLNPKAKERVGYPTQKPILLLERIIDLVTDIGDIVLDPFCGSGTTCVAAKLKERHFIGIDQSNEAVQLAMQRLESMTRTDSNLLKKGRQSYLTADPAALSLLQGIAYNPVQRNKGIDAILVQQFNNTPVLVRVQKENESITDAATLLAKAMKTKQSQKSILIQTENSSPAQYRLPNIKGMEILKSPALQIKEQLTKN